MSINKFTDIIQNIVSRSPLFSSKPLELILVINPKAGGFTRKKVFSRHLQDLNNLISISTHLPERENPITFKTLITENSGHAEEMAINLAKEAASKPQSEKLVILACGDGTSHEFQSGLMKCDQKVRDNFIIIRLPMGTGNDGSDGRDITTALGRLIKPARISSQGALCISCTEGSAKGPFYSFNIGSIGLDAYVTNMTNKLKTIMPGNSYKLWVDFATIFYDLFFKIRPMEITAFDKNGNIINTLNRKLLFLAMGISGNRQYGSNIRVLPDNDNICAVSKTHLLKRLFIKPLVLKGLHRGIKECELFSAHKLVINYSGKILTQLDGEAHLLEPEDFPIKMENMDSVIRIVEYDPSNTKNI